MNIGAGLKHIAHLANDRVQRGVEFFVGHVHAAQANRLIVLRIDGVKNFRKRSQRRPGMSRHFKLGDNRDAACIGVSNQTLQRVKVISFRGDAAVRAGIFCSELRIFCGGETPAKIIGHVKVQIANLVKPARLNHLLEIIDRVILPGNVNHHGAIIRGWPILDVDFRELEISLVGGNILEKRGRAFDDGTIIKTFNRRLIANNQCISSISCVDDIVALHRNNLIVGSD